MLRGEAIVRHKRSCARPSSDVPDQVAIGFGASRTEPSAVQVQKGLVRRTRRGTNPDARDTADRVRLERHVASGRHALHQGVVLWSRLDSPRQAFVLAYRRFKLTDRRRIIRVERMY